MNIQSLETSKKHLLPLLKKRPQISFSTIFKHFRQIQAYSQFGDFPLISEIVHQSALLNHFYSKEEIVRTMRSSDDEFLQKQRSDSKLVLILTDIETLKSKISGHK